MGGGGDCGSGSEFCTNASPAHREETHEPVENLTATCSVAVGDKVFFKSDGPEFYGTIFEFQDDGMVAGLRDISAKLSGLGCGWDHRT